MANQHHKQTTKNQRNYFTQGKRKMTIEQLRNLMALIKGWVTVFIIMVLPAYVVGAFISLESNPVSWDISGRIIFGVWAFLSFFVSAAIQDPE